MSSFKNNKDKKMSDYGDGGDIADAADKLSQLYLAIAIEQHNETKNSVFKISDLPIKGVCHYCERELEPDAENKRFCDDECQSDYVEELKKKEIQSKINGKG
jgi:Zn finger protein HypA/HybF involved in hydrogenase expression